MRIEQAHVRNFRCIVDSGSFEVEDDKTILVGINEAGKTALLRAIQHTSRPEEVPKVDYLFDAPAGIVDDIRRKKLKTADLSVATVFFKSGADDLAGLQMPEGANEVRLKVDARMSGKRWYSATGLPPQPSVGRVRKALIRLSAAMAKQADAEAKEVAAAITQWEKPKRDAELLEADVASTLRDLLDKALELFSSGSAAEGHWDEVDAALKEAQALSGVADHLFERLPPIVYFSSYFSVRPRIHLNRLAERESTKEIDPEYDFGNLQLLKFLGFTAKELSDMDSEAPEKPYDYDSNVPSRDQYEAEVRAHERRISERQKALDAAGRRLTQDIRRVWNDPTITLRLTVDGQYLMTMVEDELGVPVELDQRSEGFRWLVSFFVVFHAQAADDLKGAILLLDEPGLSLHALKQQEFRKTVSRLAEGNQIIYTTHSPFMVGADELDLVRIVEMENREAGTKVHTRLAVDDPKSIYPLQAALGYDLAQSMFTHKRNLVVEGVTDLLYIEALNTAFAADDGASLKKSTAVVPAGSASKVVYYSTILTSQNLRVAALLDSDAAGDQAAKQDALWQLLSNKRILRTGDHIKGVDRSEIEDLLRTTLAAIARDELGWDSTKTVTDQPERPLMEILSAEYTDASKWKLARAFTRWLAANGTEALQPEERAAWASLVKTANKALDKDK